MLYIYIYYIYIYMYIYIELRCRIAPASNCAPSISCHVCFYGRWFLTLYFPCFLPQTSTATSISVGARSARATTRAARCTTARALRPSLRRLRSRISSPAMVRTIIYTHIYINVYIPIHCDPGDHLRLRYVPYPIYIYICVYIYT